MSSPAPRVVAIGECMLELSAAGDAWRMGYAGDTFNTALYLARLGVPMAYLSALGRDPFSELVVPASGVARERPLSGWSARCRIGRGTSAASR